MNQPRRKAIFFKKRPFFTPFRPEKRALTDTTGIFPHVRRLTRRHYGTNSVFLRTKSDLGKPKAHLPPRYGAKKEQRSDFKRLKRRLGATKSDLCRKKHVHLLPPNRQNSRNA